MRFTPIIFYVDDAGNPSGGGGDGANNNTENKTENKVNTNVDLTKPLFTETELKEFGFDTPDQLKEHLRQRKENNVPDDQKQKKANVDKANFIKYSAEKNLMTVDDLNQYESLQKKNDRDLVFEGYAKEQKELTPELSDAEIKANFELDYKLVTDNDKLKAKAEAKIAKEAKELRSPFTSKYTTAKSEYERDMDIAAQIPVFNQFVDNLIQELTPDTLVLAKVKDKDDATETEIPVTLTKADRDEIVKTFKGPKTFALFSENKDNPKEKVAPLLTKKIQSFLKVKYFDTVANNSYVAGRGIGLANGSNKGAENPFGLVKNTEKTNDTGVKDVDKEIRESHNKIADKYK